MCSRGHIEGVSAKPTAAQMVPRSRHWTSRDRIFAEYQEHFNDASDFSASVKAYAWRPEAARAAPPFCGSSVPGFSEPGAPGGRPEDLAAHKRAQRARREHGAALWRLFERRRLRWRCVATRGSTSSALVLVVHRYRVLASRRPLGGTVGTWRPTKGPGVHGAGMEQPCGVCFRGGGFGGAAWRPGAARAAPSFGGSSVPGFSEPAASGGRRGDLWAHNRSRRARRGHGTALRHLLEGRRLRWRCVATRCSTSSALV